MGQLREEIDKIKWQRAAAETAIERAIVRGSAALGGRYKMLLPRENLNTRKNRNLRESPNTDGASNESIASNDSRLSKKIAWETVASTVDNNVKGKNPACGQYTLG